ncbi:hypothetical protein V8C86DRAFT_2519440 [Haematococcus lacustris]
MHHMQLATCERAGFAGLAMEFSCTTPSASVLRKQSWSQVAEDEKENSAAIFERWLATSTAKLTTSSLPATPAADSRKEANSFDRWLAATGALHFTPQAADLESPVCCTPLNPPSSMTTVMGHPLSELRALEGGHKGAIGSGWYTASTTSKQQDQLSSPLSLAVQRSAGLRDYSQTTCCLAGGGQVHACLSPACGGSDTSPFNRPGPMSGSVGHHLHQSHQCRRAKEATPQGTPSSQEPSTDSPLTPVEQALHLMVEPVDPAADLQPHRLDFASAGLPSDPVGQHAMRRPVSPVHPSAADSPVDFAVYESDSDNELMDAMQTGGLTPLGFNEVPGSTYGKAAMTPIQVSCAAAVPLLLPSALHGICQSVLLQHS